MTATASLAHADLTTTAVAAELGCSPQTVRRFSDAGVLRAFRLTPKSPRRFHREDVERLLARVTEGGRADA